MVLVKQYRIVGLKSLKIQSYTAPYHFICNKKNSIDNSQSKVMKGNLLLSIIYIISD